jgi:hypothetical protein
MPLPGLTMFWVKTMSSMREASRANAGTAPSPTALPNTADRSAGEGSDSWFGPSDRQDVVDDIWQMLPTALHSE